MVKRILKYLWFGIVWGLAWFIVVCLIIDLTANETVRETLFRNFSQNAFASVIIGIGFGTSSIVYTCDRLRRWQQALIHFGAGVVIFFPVAFGMKWFPSTSVHEIISCVVIATLIIVLVWSFFYLHNRHEAKRINERLKTWGKDIE